MIPSDTADVLLEDESLRDGLQKETTHLSLASKVQLFQMMCEAGLKRIQVGSFVHPERVPQMAETDQLVALLGQVPGITITGLVLNDRGLDRAIASGLRHLSISASISNSHSLKNFGKTSKESLRSLVSMIRKSVDSQIMTRAGIQCAFGCGDEAYVNKDALMEAVGLLLEAGAAEINLADTAGMATPFNVKQLARQVMKSYPDAVISLHLHDARGLAMANLFAGYEAGIRIFDTCIGGLGGCPFVDGAGGNLATEDVVNLFHSSGISTGIDLDALCTITHTYEKLLEKQLAGRYCRQQHGCLPDKEK